MKLSFLNLISKIKLRQMALKCTKKQFTGIFYIYNFYIFHMFFVYQKKKKKI
jgi:hypothetical protein